VTTPPALGKRTYGLAISTIVAILVSFCEMGKNAFELYEKGAPLSYLDAGLTTLAITSSVYATLELRHRIKILAQRSTLLAIANLGFYFATGASAILTIQALLTSSAWGLLFLIAAIVPLVFFGAWRESLEGEPDQYDLFEYAESLERQAQVAAEAARAQRAYDKFLQDNPEEAKFLRMPLSARIRSGL
jgi:hypothetical protein